MSQEENYANQPWYKQPWLLFILAPLFAVFIYGFFFLYMAIVTFDGNVKDDYYKNARGIEIDTAREDKAVELNLVANARLDDLTGDVMVQLSGNLVEKPEYLTLSLIHPGHKDYDQVLTLRRLADTSAYSGNISVKLKTGKRYTILEAADQSWTIRNEIYPPYEQQSYEWKATQR